jgi:hypothetical protein
MTGESALRPLLAEGFRIVPELSGEVLRITMSGSVGMREPGEVLNPFFAVLDEEAARAGVRTVEVDLRALGFMNSSGIATLVRWVARQEARTEGNGYRLVLMYDRKVSWQRTNVPMLATIAPGVVSANSD